MTASSRTSAGVGIVGAGRFGCALGRALQDAGYDVVAASARSATGRERARQVLGIEAVDAPEAALRGAGIVLIGVPDDATGVVAERLAQHLEPAGRTGPIHFVLGSGSVSLDALSPLAELGHHTVRLHPLVSLAPDTTPDRLRGRTAAVGASTPGALDFVRTLALDLAMVPFVLDEALRAVWHAAATIAANHTVALLAGARDLAVAAGLEPEQAAAAFSELARHALEQAAERSPEMALTGPVARGDVRTVQAHLSALRACAPELVGSYAAVAGDAVRLAAGARRIDEPTRRLMHAALSETGGGTP